MFDKQDLVISCAFIMSNAAITSLLGDWFIFNGGPHHVTVPTNVSCTVYNQESYNLFGAVCGVSLYDIDPVITTLQILLSMNLTFALVVFFLVAFKRMKKWMIKFTSIIILSLSISCVILWAIDNHPKHLPSDDKNAINRFGAGWISALVCSTTTLPLIFFL
jgi:hypothetical protein